MANVINQNAWLTCPHTTGLARPDQTDTRVTVDGSPLMTVVRPYTITACPQNTPCTKAMWIKGATRVTASGLPVAIDSGQSMCVPPGDLQVRLVQKRVQAV